MSRTRQALQEQPENAIGDVFREIWAGKFYIAVGLVFGVLAAFAFSASVVPNAKAEIAFSPANPLTVQRVTPSVPTLSGQYTSEPKSENIDFTRFENSYKGVAVANLLLKNPEITEGLKQDRAFTFSEPKQEWSAEELAEYVASRVRIDPVGETSLRSFSYYHPNAEFAVTFLQRLHAITDGLLRRDARVQIDQRIKYLNEAMAETYNPEHKRALADLLLEQERMKMMVSIDSNFAANIVVPAAVQPRAQWPDAALVYTLIPLIGAVLGFFVFSIAAVSRRQTVYKPQSASAWFKSDSGNNNARPLTGKMKQDLRLDEDEAPAKRAFK